MPNGDMAWGAGAGRALRYYLATGQNDEVYVRIFVPNEIAKLIEMGLVRDEVTFSYKRGPTWQDSHAEEWCEFDVWDTNWREVASALLLFAEIDVEARKIDTSQ